MKKMNYLQGTTKIFLTAAYPRLMRFTTACMAIALLGLCALCVTTPVAEQSQLATTLDVPANPRAAGAMVDGKATPIQAVPAKTAQTTSQSSAANPYGLSALWLQGDWVAKGCLLLLGLMSMASWYALLAKTLSLRRLKKQTRDADGVFKDVRLFAAHMAKLTVDNPVRYVADAGSVAVHQYAALKPRVDYDTWLYAPLNKP